MGRERLERRRQLYEWRCVSAAELKRLVWSMPSTEVAAIYGVSGRALASGANRWAFRSPLAATGLV